MKNVAIRTYGRLAKSKRRLQIAVESLLDPTFARVRTQGRGLLTPSVYRAIYDCVSRAPDLDVVDIGAAGGASSVAAALALKNKAARHRVFSVEKCEGGSKIDYGDFSENRTFLERNFARFRVQHQVVLFPHHLTEDNGVELLGLIDSTRIAGFIHDADGRVDRDFRLLGPLLDDRGFVIVDDYSSAANYKPVSERYPLGNAKNVVTFRLLNYILDLGLVSIEEQLGPVAFLRVRPGADFERISPARCEDIVAEVIRQRDSMLARSI